MTNQKVTVYSTPTCGYCTMVKRFLKDRGVAFTEIDVSRDHNAAQRMIQKSGQIGVPVVEIGSRIIVGFNQNEILKALGLGR
ncbi:MAG: glutaredoxin family protein [Candidatus Coatesbacteria bacterium]|nr:glutaredoxin family protein [Candidatus Coatesbacteria bacterium]